MSFSRFVNVLFSKLHENDEDDDSFDDLKNLTDEELIINLKDIKYELKQDADDVNLKNEVTRIQAELDKRNKIAADKAVKGPPVASRKIDWSKYSSDEISAFLDLAEDNPEEFNKKFTPTGEVAFQPFELNQITNDLLDEFFRKSTTKKEEEGEDTEINDEEAEKAIPDYTKPEDWNFYGYKVNQLEDFLRMAKKEPEKFKQEFDIDSDEQLKAAIIELENTLKEVAV